MTEEVVMGRPALSNTRFNHKNKGVIPEKKGVICKIMVLYLKTKVLHSKNKGVKHSK